MRKSFEFSHKKTDLDQVDPEHASRETAEYSWDDLRKEPFRGNQKNSRANSKDVARATVRDLKALVDSLPFDGDNETARAIAAEKVKQQVSGSMEDVGTFGKGYRSRNLPPAEGPKSETDYKQELSDISATF